ncbi:MAG: helix-turn-helix domain-containing protein [Candidatus Aenigmatarchaeota archaeon]
MEKKEILELLGNFGLSEYESKAYCSLLLSGPSKAGDLSFESGVPQSKIYETLEMLMEKQMIEVFEGRPKEYKALPTDQALRNLIEEKEVEIQKLKTNTINLTKVLKENKEEKEVLEGVWMVKGRKFNEFFDILSDMLNKSEKYAIAITKNFSYSSRLREAVKSCKRRKVDFKIIGIGPITSDNYLRAKWYHANGIPVRVFDTNIHPRILVIDGKEVNIRLDHEHTKKKFAFHSISSRDPSLVKVMDTYMKNLWNHSMPVDFKKVPT